MRAQTFTYKFLSPKPKRNQQPVKNPLALAQRYGVDVDLGAGSGTNEIVYETSLRGNKLLHYGGHKYIRNNVYFQNVYWKCTKWHSGCRARAITSTVDDTVCSTKNVHTHSD